MLSIQSFANGVLAEIVRRQPASKEKTAFAWQIAAGPALARRASVELTGGELRIRPRDPRWAREIHRAADMILSRKQHLLGATAVTRVSID